MNEAIAESAVEEVPTHHRSLEVDVFERGGNFVAVARLRDERPWAAATEMVEHVHDMELVVTVRPSDLVITEARATMNRFPHAECVDIEEAFGGLVGLSVARGYTRAVQERFGRALGCTHLEFMARAIGPVVVQAIPSSLVRRADRLKDTSVISESGTGWLTDSCHVWAVGGPGQHKLELGWRPGKGPYPAPSVVELRRGAPPPGLTG